MRIAYRGNFMLDADLPAGIKPWSTEHHVAASLELLGHTVVRCPEASVPWEEQVEVARTVDLFLWTSTYDHARLWSRDDERAGVDEVGSLVPTVGFHLDLWWTLDREQRIYEDGFFRVRYLFTADGDHDAAWEKVGIRHFWSPPAVYGPECVSGTPVEDWRSDVAFVGSWDRYAHAEWWPHRAAMLDAARAHFGARLALWPRPGRGAVRSKNLNDLLASVKVVLGDSCLADRSDRYWSDRVPETIGRGGFLVMPDVPGLVEAHPPGLGVAYYPRGDHAAMVETAEWWVAHDDERAAAVVAGMELVRREHTYERRLEAVLATVDAETASARA